MKPVKKTVGKGKIKVVNRPELGRIQDAPEKLWSCRSKQEG